MKKVTPTTGEYNQLVTLFNAGRYAELENRTRLLIERYPDFGAAWKMLGAALWMQGKNGLSALQKATELMPDDAEAHYNLGDTFTKLGRLGEAEASYRQVLRIRPDIIGAHINLGMILYKLGRLAEAETSYRRALQIKPDLNEAHYNLGILYKKQGRLMEAEASYRRALQIKPDFAEAHFNLGATLKDLDRLDEAEASYRLALQIKPNYADAYYNLGNILYTLGRLEESEANYRQAIRVKPDLIGAHFCLGATLKDLGRLDEAEACFSQAAQIKPDSADAYCNLGNILQNFGRLQDAEASYRQAILIKPDLSEAHYGLGNTLKKLYRLDEAEVSYRKALQIKPDFADVYNNLGLLFEDVCRLDEAIPCLRRAVALNPHNTQFHSNLVYSLYFHPAYDDQSILAEVKQFASAHRQPRLQVSSHARHDFSPERRLRIGYVSPDFRNHCQSLFTIPLLSNHDHTQFEIFCYANLARSDEISERLTTYADVWRSTNGISDARLAEIIANDGIDILVDLTMHMAKGRPMLFTCKPAPAQVAWLAYPGTTGIPEIDYRFTDPWLDPPEFADDRYTETSIHLPDTFWCYDPLVSGLQPNALPALAAGYVTFGCLNNFCKVTDDTLCRWGQVMARTPLSRLILLSPPGTHRQRVLDLLGQFGVAAGRIEFAEHKPRPQYLQTYNRIDLCLDTLPANGHTTSLDSFWMGVPVVTRVGHTAIGRGGWSQLNNLGLPELAAFDDQAFIDIAVALATDLPRLSQLRLTLRSRMEASPLMDGKRFAAAIETAYRQIWKKLCGMSEER